MSNINEIDVEKLRALKVPEEIIASLDLRNGGNIDDDGNVLFLDEERQKRKERPDRPMRKNKPDGLGIKNAIVRKISADASAPKEDGDDGGAFPVIAGLLTQEKEDIKKKLIQTMFGYGKKGYTYATMLPLNVDFSSDTNSGVLPIQLVFEALEDAEYIAILDFCICRKNFKCQDYPADFGCIFLNVAGRRVVEAGIARQATVEEAKQHVLKAKEHGLLANSEFVEAEQFIWGLKNSDMNQFRMICFCCPCCCLIMKAVKSGNAQVRERNVSCGYTSTINHSKCVGCHSCAKACPQQAITYREDGKAVINQEVCMGCGWCSLECENGAIRIQQTFPVRKSLNEYFLKEARIDDGLPHDKK